MTQVKRILFATDYFESSRLSLDYAIAMAHHFDATLVMLHASDFPPSALEAELVSQRPSVSRKEAEARLEGLALGARRAGVQTEVHIQPGGPSDVILAAVEDLKIDLLVLGTHGTRQGLSHLILGSNVEKILLAVRCPTLTVGAHVMAGIHLELHLSEILYFADQSYPTGNSAEFARMLADTFHVPLEVYPIAAMKEDESQDFNAGEVQLSAVKPDQGAEEQERPRSTDEFELQTSDAVASMLHRARTQTSGLIVLNVHPETFLERHTHTTFAYKLVAEATCPVITVRN